MDFEENRQRLLKEAYDLQENIKFSDKFNRHFFELIEDVVLYLLQTQDVFFGQFLLRVKRNINIDIEVPIATLANRDGFNMYFNPILFLQCTRKEMSALFKHEIYHIINSHFIREKKLKDRFSKEAINVALDIAINQFIKDLPGFSKQLNSVNREYNISLEENRTIEEYANEIDKSIKSRIKDNKIVDKNLKYEMDMSKVHDFWDKSDLSNEDIDNLTKKTALGAYSKNTPNGLENIILSYKEKAEIPWQSVLKNILPNAKSGYKKTITRKNRRQPERLDLRGRLPKLEIDLIVAIDISASINEENMHKILLEILSITSNTKNKITIIECDNDIKKIYDIKNEKDILKRSNNNGSTKFSPVFKYIKNNNLRNSILIYFTDGVGEKELEVKPINKKTIWVISGNEQLSLKNPYGEIKRINKDKKELIDGNLGLKMVNEAIHDWAR